MLSAPAQLFWPVRARDGRGGGSQGCSAKHVVREKTGPLALAHLARWVFWQLGGCPCSKGTGLLQPLGVLFLNVGSTRCISLHVLAAARATDPQLRSVHRRLPLMFNWASDRTPSLKNSNC